MTRADQRKAGRADQGFTLIELAVAMVVFGLFASLSVTGWVRYQASQAHVSASHEVVSVLRNAQMRATAEATTYRVDVDAASRRLVVYRFDGATYVQRSTTQLEGGGLTVDQASFTDSSGASTTSAFFYARGTASPGTVVLGRDGAQALKTVEVEGLTGRVSSS